MTNHAECTLSTRHCESCGSTDREDLDGGDQGYTACCNECIAYPDALGGTDCRGHHLS